MAEPFVGEIRMFAGSFAPAGWAFCAGQLMPISENDVLFNLIGTTYGGDGQETFGMPDLQGRVPVHVGQGPGITQNYQLGERGGVETVTLTVNQIPAHSHPPIASLTGTADTPAGGFWAGSSAKQFAAVPPTGVLGTPVSAAGGNQPHENMPPFVAINYIISLFGIYPTQS